jgi:hypothetical protein
MTLRSRLGLTCNMQRTKTEKEITDCIDKRYDKDDLLARQTRYYMHMWAYEKGDLEKSTSFLYTARNPVERLISTYKYS